MVAIESNGEDGDVRYLDLKLNYLREKKNNRITSRKWYRLLSPVLKSDVVTCSLVEQRLK